MATREEMIAAARAGEFIPFPFRQIAGRRMDLKAFISDTLDGLYPKDQADLVMYLTGLRRGTPAPLSTWEQLFFRGFRNGLITP